LARRTSDKYVYFGRFKLEGISVDANTGPHDGAVDTLDLDFFYWTGHHMIAEIRGIRLRGPFIVFHGRDG
jgi:hypothetical protein